MQNPFVWAGNQPVDQNQLATRRALANALINKSLDTSPVQHWTQALARVAQGVAGMRQGQFADEDEGKAKAELGSVRNAMLGGDAAQTAAPQGGLVNVTPPPPQNPLMKSGDVKGYDNPASRALYDAAIAKGYTPVQAAAFVGAGALPESTLNPNARNPGDGRDGSDSIGMFQWNSSRAKALQEFAASKGKPWNDPNVQAEFALAELEGPEAKAGQMLRGAKTPEEATGAMLAYLRPGGYKPGAPQGVPSYGARLRNTTGVMSAFSGGMAVPQQPLVGVQPMQEQPPVQVAQAPQAAPAGQAPQAPAAPAGGISQERLRAAYTILNSPFAGPGDKAVAQTIIQKALTAETKDPLDIRLKQAQVQQAEAQAQLTPLQRQQIELGNKKAERDLMPEGARPLTPEERQQFGFQNDQAGYFDTKLGKPVAIGTQKTALTLDNRQESEFGKETGKALAQRFNAMATEGDEAIQNQVLVDELRRLGGRIQTGASAAVTKRLADLGIKLEGASDVEAYSALIDRLTPQQRVPGSGATSDFDAKMFKGSLPSIMNTPGGNELIIGTMEKLNANRIARGDIAMRVQAGELKPNEAVGELRKLQAEARALSDSVKNFGKDKQGNTPSSPQSPTTGDGWRDMGNGVRIREKR